jgi:nicotinamidase-related amidase
MTTSADGNPTFGIPSTTVRDVVKLLRPEKSDYFVIKPKHSGFFSTSLETLLRYLETEDLILTGIAGNFCVLFTANDAYMHDFNLFVPSDCTVSNTKKENNSALGLMKKFLKADTRSSSRIELHGWHTWREFESR